MRRAEPLGARSSPAAISLLLPFGTRPLHESRSHVTDNFGMRGR